MPPIPRPISRLCVFCGASNGAHEDYPHAARQLGAEMARRRITLIYGGGRAGLMGAVADACLEEGGQVVGVITRLLQNRELEHKGVTSLHVVETMHERKMMMANLADAFIALPGGLGTLDEMFEILAWAQLGIHSKPVGLLNTRGYYDSLMAFLDHVEVESFLRLNLRATIVNSADPQRIIDALAAVEPRRDAPRPG
ncbi:MAG: TIGR00730 family Rossman fold protein [Planctomycetes bacterium]|nr:TIGR00730 family Rossman fold protein [Planctomycetota bacterium]